ncbi:MAPEG family protein [Undibacterium sp. Dicai25W]|uniref:MAPEG family protein n=1 Tax=Undibacterium sp. Dicai25W TaxID=3413034 RepID=UPI003BF0A8DE
MQILWTSWLTVVVLAMYFWNVVTVGKARGKYGVKAPSVEGPEDFQRALRVQANTVEQLVFFFPALWLCALWFSDKTAAIAGVVWVVGRILYALAYLKDPSKRGAGFAVATLASLALWLGAIVGLTGLVH